VTHTSGEIFSLQQSQWQQGELIEIPITDFTDQGDGVGRWTTAALASAEASSESRVVFVPATVPGDRVQVRLVRVKPRYAYAQLVKILEPSPDRQRPECIVADKCGGCQWQHVDYETQQRAKKEQVIQALKRIGQFADPPVDSLLANAQQFHYRNKATYPLGQSATGQVQAGYYRKGSHRLVNLNQCPIQDDRLDPLLASLKQDIQAQGWQIYDEVTHQGALRHLSLRIGQQTGQILITLVSRERTLPGLEEQAALWCDRYQGENSQVVGVCLNHNPQRTNAIFGSKTICLAGQDYLEESWGGLRLRLRSDTFFQIHSDQAEKLLAIVLAELQLTGTEAIVDAYCGIGTLTLPLAQQAGQVWGIESLPSSVHQARENAALNGLEQVHIEEGTVEAVLPQLPFHPDIVVLDPPRKGCDRQVLDTLLRVQPQRIVYLSCNPATLARDLKILCETQVYRLSRVQPADFFPQTAHVEAVAFLQLGVGSA
jgi:23S rRNA (uracil1939-C5)-methyltransferase